MFSAMKKLAAGGSRKEEITGNSTSMVTTAVSSSVITMPTSLQKKFSKGVNYNMKVVLRGDRSTGKSALSNRLEGKPFVSTYTPTEEIAVCSIQWSYKATDDIVKVEVWDVVDKGKKRVPLEGLKIFESGSSNTPALDAEFVNVYKGAHGCILLYDITKAWTFDYVQKELPRIPKHIPILVLGNFAEASHHRVINREEALNVIQSIERDVSDARICYSESSMQNGFGLKYIHKFLNLPFLALQRSSLLQTLLTNDKEIELAIEELTLAPLDELNYEIFSDRLLLKRRAVAESNAPPSITNHSNSVKCLVSEIKDSSSFSSSSSCTNTTLKESKSVDLYNFVPEALPVLDTFLIEDEDIKEQIPLSFVEHEEDEEQQINHLVANFSDDIEFDEDLQNRQGLQVTDNNIDLDSDTEKEKNSHKTKRKVSRKKGKRKESRENETEKLEEFLNGSSSPRSQNFDDVYEEL